MGVPFNGAPTGAPGCGVCDGIAGLFAIGCIGVPCGVMPFDIGGCPRAPWGVWYPLEAAMPPSFGEE